ncbi:hypothetical protein GM418_22410 [Maribellus comscasis]|uniref:Uncharacterized protein n=1 Tax=Maribellus comscasis TaxID=2681766 RepID=A0A6I6JTE1_9BACT|nr:hypothetical protein [Maribellus comscasis]QGY46315.1 hypothetical protein GM418_22410 [Maribellus comscasis]
MAEKEIALLKEQITRLDEKNFDLEAWKNHTLIFLERIFGKDSSKIKMIKDLHYDYSSWSLRDTAAAGKTKDKDPVRMQADEILRATVAELESLGLPENKKEQEKVWELLQDELTGKQVKEIEALQKSEDPEKTEKIAIILEKLEKENLALIIAKLLTT